MSKPRMQLLNEMIESLKEYTHEQKTWRPGLVDLAVYNEMIDMHESDMDNPEFAEYLWKSTPDVVMEYVIETNHGFESALEFGSEQLYEELRDYLIEEDFMISIDDADDEDDEQLTEGAN